LTQHYETIEVEGQNMLDDRELDETLELLPPPPGMVTNGAFCAWWEPCYMASLLCRASDPHGERLKPAKAVNPVNSIGVPSRSTEGGSHDQSDVEWIIRQELFVLDTKD
jgi:hypothetical protein